MKNNLIQSVLKEFSERYEQQDGEMGYFGWINETGYGEIEQFLEQKLTHVIEEIEKEHQKELEELKKEIVGMKRDCEDCKKGKYGEIYEKHGCLTERNVTLNKVSKLIDQRLSVKENR